MTRLYFDTEFMEDGERIELLSIGVVRDDGNNRATLYYAENAEADYSHANPWVLEHVVPYLEGVPYRRTRAQIAADLVAFAGPDPEWWSYYASYDWVALCQLYGAMVDLPAGWPMYVRDLRQWLDDHGHADVSQPDSHPHHALSDAQWIADTHLRLAGS